MDNDKNGARHVVHVQLVPAARKQENILSPSKNIYAVLQYFD